MKSMKISKFAKTSKFGLKSLKFKPNEKYENLNMLSYIFAVKNQLFRNSLNIAFSQFSPKKWNHLQFYKRNPFKNESDQKKSYYNKRPWGNFLLLRIFFKNSLQEGDFENSLKFLQLVPNLTPIRKLLCTFLYLCYCYP